MKLTIIRLENFSDQDRIDLQKIWPEYSPSSLQVDDNHRIYAARFNERLLAAVRVTLSGTEGALDSLRVREVTRTSVLWDAPGKRFTFRAAICDCMAHPLSSQI